jgi:hypothetical protein
VSGRETVEMAGRDGGRKGQTSDRDKGRARMPRRQLVRRQLKKEGRELWKQPRCPTTDEWIKKMCYLYQWNSMQP